MDVLKQLCTDIGLLNVQTYIQSGNIVYQASEQDCAILSQNIHNTILAQLGLDIPTFTLSSKQFDDIINQNPFTAEEELAQLYITFIEGVPYPNGKTAIEEKKADNELLHITTSAIFLIANIGYDKTKVNNTLIENKLKVTATTRNYKTCLKLISLATTI